MAYKQPIEMPSWLKQSLKEAFLSKQIEAIRIMTDNWLNKTYDAHTKEKSRC